MKFYIVPAMVFILCTGKILSAPVPPYAHSDTIREITWHWETDTNAAIGSDLWPITWGPDDNIYTSWGDGGGFGGSDTDGRVSMGFARIEGTPENWHGININGGKHSQFPSSFPKKGKTAGVIFVNGILYALVNLQDGNWPDVNHALAWSTNNAATWTMAGWRFPKGEGQFQPAIFLNFARNDAGMPAPVEGYVYIYGYKRFAPAKSADKIYLTRVPTNRITDRAAYEFFAKMDSPEKPAWTSDSGQATPVFIDPHNQGIGSVAYAPALKRYLFTAFHGGPGQLGIFDSPNPWGPWTTIDYEEHFGGMGSDGEGLLCSFPQKWMSADGLTLWTIFSCYGGSAKTGIHAHDRFNLVKATLSLRNSSNP